MKARVAIAVGCVVCAALATASFRVIRHPISTESLSGLSNVTLGAVGRAALDRPSETNAARGGYASTGEKDVRMGKTQISAAYVAAKAKSSLKSLPKLSTELLGDSALARDGWDRPFCVTTSGNSWL